MALLLTLAKVKFAGGGVVDGYADAADRRMAILTSDKP
jgi:hypothetical protein